MRRGFTLLELSLVLVIISLIIGGVMVGRDMIRQSEIRRTLAQIDEYQTAARTFKMKYGQFPGDIGAAAAAQFGFATRSGAAGYGDQDGKIQGENNVFGTIAANGEVILFWNDLSTAQLISESFTRTVSINPVVNVYTDNASGGNNYGPFSPYFPIAKLGNGLSIVAFQDFDASLSANAGIPNYDDLVFQVATVSRITNNGQTFRVNSSLSIIDAASIDTKLDDGLPETGKIVSAGPGRASVTQQAIGTSTRLTSLRGATEDFCVNNTSPFRYNTAFPDSVACNIMMAKPLY